MNKQIKRKKGENPAEWLPFLKAISGLGVSGVPAGSCLCRLQTQRKGLLRHFLLCWSYWVKIPRGHGFNSEKTSLLKTDQTRLGAVHLQEAESIQAEGVQTPLWVHTPLLSADPSVGADLSVSPAAEGPVQRLLSWWTWPGCVWIPRDSGLWGPQTRRVLPPLFSPPSLLQLVCSSIECKALERHMASL